MIKVGSKVIGVTEVDGVFPTTDVTGVVEEVNQDGSEYVVRFDKYVGGWGDNDNMLVCHESHIKLLDESLVAKNKLLFAKVKPNAIIPSKRDEDGAFDLYACFDEDYMVIKPHETKMIPTGLASAFSSDYVAILKERGSTGTKGIGQRAGVVDSGYRGEWFVPVTNHNNVPLIISKNNDVCAVMSEHAIVYPYTKGIAQVIMVEVPKLTIDEVSLDEIKSYSSERGEGALGSSNK